MAAAAVYQVHPVVNTVTLLTLGYTRHNVNKFASHFSTQISTVITQELLPSGLVGLWMEE